MCFSAEANFVATGIIGAVGVATLAHVREPRSVLFATMPILFALHQFTEAFVWLGLDGRVRPEARDHLVFLFLLYAQGVLPILMPLGVLLMEPPGPRRWLTATLTGLGAMLGAWMFYGLIAYPSTATAEHHSIVYDNAITKQTWVAVVYVVATCGALLASSHRVVRWFGIANVVGVVTTMLLLRFAFTSAWCLYAAVLSIMLFWQFRGRHIDVRQPNSSFRDAPVSLRA